MTKASLVFLIGVALRVAIIVTNPIVWGGDTIVRLFDGHTLLKSHQLPMLQALISGISRISMDTAMVQYLMAVIGGIAGVGFYLVVSDLCGDKWAFAAALLFVTHPYVLAVSTVPFQEILMLAGLLFAFHFFYRGRWGMASICLAVACLTRFEAWAACPVLAIAYCARKDRTLRGLATSAALFGWLPIAWILARHGLTPTGHFAVEPPLSFWRLQRYVYLGWIVVKFTQPTVLLLAGAAAWHLYRRGSRADWRWWIPIAFTGLFLAAVPFSAHGVMPDPERYVTSREAHIPMLLVLLLAAAGVALCGPRWRRALVALTVAIGVGEALWYVRVQCTEPWVSLDYRVAKYLDHEVGSGERVLLLANPIAADVAALYVEKASETGGEQGRRQAQIELHALAATPPDYQRVVVYSRLGRDRLLTPPADCADWVVVWSDYPDAGRELAGVQATQVMRSGPHAVSILRRDCATGRGGRDRAMRPISRSASQMISVAAWRGLR